MFSKPISFGIEGPKTSRSRIPIFARVRVAASAYARFTILWRINGCPEGNSYKPTGHGALANAALPRSYSDNMFNVRDFAFLDRACIPARY